MLTDSVKKKFLRDAFELAIEHHDLDHYKTLLASHEARLQQEARDTREAEERAAEKKKSKKRQSVAAADEDVEMEDVADAEVAEKPKAAKKRKAEEAAVGSTRHTITRDTGLTCHLLRLPNDPSRSRSRR